jgi:phage terminase large subunit
MQTMTRWTDDRMDDLSAKADETNRRIDGMDRGFREEFRAVRAEAQAESRALRGEIKALQTMMIRGFITVLATMISGFAAILSQL